jgi:hypothetical protein
MVVPAPPDCAPASRSADVSTCSAAGYRARSAKRRATAASPSSRPERQAPQRLAVRRDLDEVGGGIPFVGVDGQADPRGGVEPGPRRRRAEPDAHHVLHEPVHPQDRPLAVDERKAQQLADGFLHVQLVAVGERPQHLDGDRVGREERHRLQHPGGQRRAPPEPVEREAPGGGDGTQLGLPAAVEAHVVGHGHAGLLDVGAGLLQGKRQVAEQLGQLGGGRGVRVAAALDDVGDRLRAGERRHRDRAGQPSPGLVAGGDDDVAVHRGGQVGLQPGGLVGVVEHEHPARCPVQLGPQRGAGVLLARPVADAQGRGEIGQARGGARGVLGADPPRHAARPLPPVRELARQLGLARSGHAVQHDRAVAPSSSAASTTAASSGRSTNARARCGRFDRSAGPAALTVPSACWASTAAWTRRSGGAGSTPSCSAKARRQRS